MIVITEARNGLFIGEKVFSLTGLKLKNPYRVHFNEESIDFGPVGLGLANIKEIQFRTKDIFFYRETLPEIKKEYEKAVQKDNLEV